MGPLEEPTTGVGKAGVGNTVGSPVRNHLDVVDLRLARTEQEQLQLVGRPFAKLQQAVVLDLRPWRLARFIARQPVGGVTVVGIGIDEFQAAAAAVRTALRIGVGQRVDDDEAHPGTERDRPRQRHRLTTARQRATEIAKHDPGIQLRVIREQRGAIFRHHRKPSDGDARPVGKAVFEAARERPASEVDRRRPAVVQLDILAAVGVQWPVHDLVDHDSSHLGRRVRPSGRGAGERTNPIGMTVRIAAEGGTGRLRTETQGIDHPRASGILQVGGLARRRKAKPEGARRELDEAASRDGGAARDHKQVGRRIIGQNAAGQIDLGETTVVELDEILRGSRRVGAQLVDEDVIEHRARQHVPGAGIPADAGALRPRSRVVLPVGRTRQDQRVTSTVSRHRPRVVIAVSHVQNHAARPLGQPQRTTGVGQRSRPPRSEHAGDAVLGCEVRRVRGDHQERVGADRRPLRKVEFHRAVQAVSTERLRPRVRVVDLDELQHAAITPRARVVHDFGERETAAPAARSERLAVEFLIGRQVERDLQLRRRAGGAAPRVGDDHRVGTRIARARAGDVEGRRRGSG